MYPVQRFAELTPRDLHIDVPLTNISVAYKNLNYIADSVFPIVMVRKQSDLIPVYDKSHWFRDTAALRAYGDKSKRGGFSIDNGNPYFCRRYSWGYEIPDQVRFNNDNVFELDNNGVRFVMDKLFLRREVSLADKIFKTGVWKNDMVGGTDVVKWSNYDTSTPLIDVTNGTDAVEFEIGIEPNQFIMGKAVWLAVKWHPDLIDAIKYVQRGTITEEMAASLFEVPSIKIGKSRYTTSPEGTAEASVAYSRIWGDNALLLYTPDSPSLMTPSAGYTFVWGVANNGSIQYMKRMRDDEREVDIIEGNTYYDQFVLSDDAGYFFSDLT